MKRPSILLATLLVATVSAQKLNWGESNSRELKGKGYRVLLHVQNFKAGSREIGVRIRPGSVGSVTLDGTRIYGLFKVAELIKKHKGPKQMLETEATEISKFDVWLNGKRIQIPRDQYDYLLRPNLAEASAKLSKDGKTLTVSLGGADGAAGWITSWTVRSNGKVKPGKFLVP